MRVRLKGVNWIRKKLADGSYKTYWYAWKGGPSLPGKPGSAEFIAAYNAAIAQKVEAPRGSLLTVINAYQNSGEFLNLSDRTRSDYVTQMKKIEAEFADFPIAALSDRRSRADFLAWRDDLALKSRRQADYAFTVLARVLSWALNRGLVAGNPCEKSGRLYRGTRSESIWTDDDETAFLSSAPAHLHLPLLLALWTGQRQGDLLRLAWSAYDGSTIRLRQSKTGVRVTIPVGAPLKRALDATARRSPIILVNESGKPWTGDGFRSSFTKAKIKAGIAGVTFNDLRGTAVTRLALSGCIEAEIATLTGHALRDVRSILDAHYLARHPALAQSAVSKLEKRTKNPTALPTGTSQSEVKSEKT